jgi:hypothetical protein
MLPLRGISRLPMLAQNIRLAAADHARREQAAAVWTGAHGSKLYFEALPGTPPRVVTDAPGKTRLAKRDQLRRARVV